MRKDLKKAIDEKFVENGRFDTDYFIHLIEVDNANNSEAWWNHIVNSTDDDFPDLMMDLIRTMLKMELKVRPSDGEITYYLNEYKVLPAVIEGCADFVLESKGE